MCRLGQDLISSALTRTLQHDIPAPLGLPVLRDCPQLVQEKDTQGGTFHNEFPNLHNLSEPRRYREMD